MTTAYKPLRALSREDYESIVSGAYMRPDMRIRRFGVEVNAGPSSFEGSSSVRIYIERLLEGIEEVRVFVGNLLNDGTFEPNVSATMSDSEEMHVGFILTDIIDDEARRTRV